MQSQADIGLIGLAVMGRNLALNLADHGYTVAVFNRSPEKTREFSSSAEAQGKNIIPCESLEQFIASIRKPAPVIFMIKAGEAVDEQIDKLLPLLAPGDILMDGGNSHFLDTRRRAARLEASGIRYLGVGISGGEEGARTGPSIMPGGDAGAYETVSSMLSKISAKVDGRACSAYIGPDGAGHYVKMVHNGIEYADMQIIAEAYFILRHLAGMSHEEMSGVFADWNRGELSSYLIEITADILGRVDESTGQPLVEVILDSAGQKGTGAWTGESALLLGVPVPTVIEAVQARSLSSLKAERMVAASRLPGPVPAAEEKARIAESVRSALYAAKICCYAQGFALLRAAGEEYGWGLRFGEISMLWRGGCIIRAAFLERIKDAYERDPELSNLLLDPYFTESLAHAQSGWRDVVSRSVLNGIPAPAFASALSYYDGYRTGRLWANMIQAQRDYFGAHTYRRIDMEGVHHTEWANKQ